VKILISAAEASSDAHGAELLRSLKKIAAQSGGFGAVEAYGTGGPKLQAAGLRIVVDARDLLAMGFTEILGRLPKIFSSLKKLTREATAQKPDVIVVIDYPDFHFRLAKRLKSLGVPIVYYIPPKVWVWRKKRIRMLQEFFAKVLVILPFEEKFYTRENVKVKYVGNPLVDELPLNLTRGEARVKLGLAPDDTVMLAMPGSRKSEINKHLELMLDAALDTSLELANLGVLKGAEKLHVLLPIPHTSNLALIRAKMDRWEKSQKSIRHIKIHLSQSNSSECMVAADVGMIKSGTSTLEAGILGLPHFIVYKPSFIAQFVFQKIIRYAGPVGLVNLVAGSGGQDGPDSRKPYLIREIVCQEVNRRSLSEQAILLLINRSLRSEMRKSLENLRAKILANQQSPSETAAHEILEMIQCKPA